MDLSIPYYKDNTRISNSALGWFMNNGPSFLHKKLSGLIPEEKGPQLEKGTMIHEYILQPEEFNKDYLLFSGTKPKSEQQSKFCEALINNTEIEPDKRLLSAYNKAYSIVGKSAEKMLSEARKIASELNPYIDALKDGRKLISMYDVQKCQDVLHNIEQHKAASVLLNNPDWEEYHEFHINWECCGVKCKSLLDCVKFDFENKRCQLIDLKTTVKLWHFQDSIHQYDYMRQLCFYYMAIRWYLIHEKSEDPDEWKWEYYIVAIDSAQNSDIRVFEFHKADVIDRMADISDTILDIKWHQSNNLWEHTKEYYVGNGCETLDL